MGYMVCGNRNGRRRFVQSSGFFFFFLSKVLDQFPVQDLCDFQILVI